MRNKPKEPPKVPKAAPFFLPTIAGLQPKFDIQDNKEEGDKVSHSLHSTYTARSSLIKISKLIVINIYIAHIL